MKNGHADFTCRNSRFPFLSALLLLLFLLARKIPPTSLRPRPAPRRCASGSGSALEVGAGGRRKAAIKMTQRTAAEGAQRSFISIN